jgi:hypothetical protein
MSQTFYHTARHHIPENNAFQIHNLLLVYIMESEAINSISFPNMSTYTLVLHYYHIGSRSQRTVLLKFYWYIVI